MEGMDSLPGSLKLRSRNASSKPGHLASQGGVSYHPCRIRGFPESSLSARSALSAQIGDTLNPLPDRPLLIASGNSNKHREIRQALLLPPEQLLTPEDLEKTHGSAPDPVEDGSTLLENAVIKACEFSHWSGQLSLADDTGLFVSGLDGEPGVYSARYAGPEASFTDNIDKLLKSLSERENASREAYFSCVLALCDGDEVLLSVEGRCPGIIAEEPHGEGGFGYDPIFIPEGQTLTFSEMSPEDKNKISHRGLAVQKFSQLFEAVLKEGEKS